MPPDYFECKARAKHEKPEMPNNAGILAELGDCSVSDNVNGLTHCRTETTSSFGTRRFLA
jgi:hypothetical protein